MIKVYRDVEQLSAFKNAVITIGTFDGVHLGHQQIIRQLKEEAAAMSGETVIITFHPHPRQVVGGKQPVRLLNTLDEKLALLASRGIEHVVVIPFDEAFANQPPEVYIKDFLVDKFHPHTIIIGYDHRFGKNRSGDYHLLEEKGAVYGYEVKEIPERILNEVTVSSTRIREALTMGDIATANKFLGYTYFFEGEVVHGNKLGRTLGYPTANLHMNDDEKLVPGNGIYAVTVSVSDMDVKLKGMMSIGVRPTINGTVRVIEVNIFDFNRDIYGKSLKVYVEHYLRPEVKFAGLEELKQQLALDKEHTETVLGE